MACCGSIDPAFGRTRVEVLTARTVRKGAVGAVVPVLRASHGDPAGAAGIRLVRAVMAGRCWGQPERTAVQGAPGKCATHLAIGGRSPVQATPAPTVPTCPRSCPD